MRSACAPRKYDVAVVGVQCIDVNAAPVARGVMERELTLVKNMQLALGGDALNQAVVLSRLGAKVALMGLTGVDRLGDILIEQLSAHENLTVLNHRAEVNTAISLVLVEENGERHFIYQPDSNRQLSIAHIDNKIIAQARFLSVGGCLSLPGLEGEGMLRLMSLARKQGTQTCLDFSISGYPWDECFLRALFPLTDYILPSRLEAEAITKESGSPQRMARALQDMGAGNLIIKLGGEGCYVCADGYEGMIPACPCTPVDTTGAGDNFVAAFLYAKTHGFSNERCARFACAAGSIAVEHPGANAAIQSAEAVLQRMGE